MQRTIAAATFARRIAAITVIATFVILLVRFVLPQATAAVDRIAEIALRESSGLLGLALLCVAAGLLIIVNRSRRSKVRQASS